MKKLIALLAIVSFLIIPSAPYKANASICNLSAIRSEYSARGLSGSGLEQEAIDSCLAEQRRLDQQARDQAAADTEGTQALYQIKLDYFYKLDALEKQLNTLDTNSQCRLRSADCLQSMRIPSDPTSLDADIFLGLMGKKEKCFDYLSQCIGDKIAAQVQQPTKTDDQICSEKFGSNWKWISGTTCGCKDGYTQKGGDCVTYDQSCNISYPNTIFFKFNSTDGKRICDCKTGYEWNSQRTSCIVAPVVPVKTNDQICQDSYGINSSWNGTKNNAGGLICDCKAGHEWNNGITACIKTPEEVLNSETSGRNIVVPEGAIIRAENDIDVYIVKYIGTKKFKRLILSPSVFNNYGHLKWENLIIVSQATLDSFITSDLVRAVGDDKIYRLYPQGDSGQKRLLKDSSVIAKLGLDSDSIYEINSFDRESYVAGAMLE